jgi:hypothetical protein
MPGEGLGCFELLSGTGWVCWMGVRGLHNLYLCLNDGQLLSDLCCLS